MFHVAFELETFQTAKVAFRVILVLNWLSTSGGHNGIQVTILGTACVVILQETEISFYAVTFWHFKNFSHNCLVVDGKVKTILGTSGQIILTKIAVSRGKVFLGVQCNVMLLTRFGWSLVRPCGELYAHRSSLCWDMAIFSRWRLYAYLDHPRRALASDVITSRYAEGKIWLNLDDHFSFRDPFWCRNNR